MAPTATMLTVGLFEIAAAAEGYDIAIGSDGAGMDGAVHLFPAGGLGPAPAKSGKVPQALAAGDFNADGYGDLAVTASEGSVAIMLSTGTTFEDATLASGRRIDGGDSSVAVGDFNGDTRDDLATVANNDVSFLLGAGNGTFGARQHNAVPGATAVAVGDFNADGREDLVSANASGDDVSVLLGKVGGGFEDETNFTAGDSPLAVGVGDFDADGFEDVVTANSASDNVSVLLGAGDVDGSLRPKMDFDVGDDPQSLAIGDFNSDGDEDLAVANAGDDDVSILLGSTGRGFTRAPDVATGDRPVSIAVADINLDLNDDLVVHDDLANQMSILNGGGPSHMQGNLLDNGFAWGKGAQAGWDEDLIGSITGVEYSTAGGFPQHLDAARWGGGPYLFTGGNSPLSSASQTLDVSASAAAIDGDTRAARLSADLGGYRTQNDRMEVSAAFLDAAGATLGNTSIGPVTSADCHNVTQLIRREALTRLPPGTRRIKVTMTATRASGPGTYNDAYADNVKLTLADVPPPSQPAMPDPTSVGGDGGSPGGAEQDPGERADRTPPDTIKGKGPKKRTKKRRAKFNFSSSEPGSSFECKLDKNPAKSCSSPATATKLKRGKHTFSATAIDAAGNRDPSPATWNFKVAR